MRACETWLLTVDRDTISRFAVSAVDQPCASSASTSNSRSVSPSTSTSAEVYPAEGDAVAGGGPVIAVVRTWRQRSSSDSTTQPDATARTAAASRATLVSLTRQPDALAWNISSSRSWVQPTPRQTARRCRPVKRRTSSTARSCEAEMTATWPAAGLRRP